MITFKHKGSFKNTEAFFRNVKNGNYMAKLQELGDLGVNALYECTPKLTGKTAASWTYEIIQNKNSTSIIWSNTNVVNYVNIAVILQYGHATRNGGWVEGVDYVNPAMQPIFDRIANEAWEAVIGR